MDGLAEPINRKSPAHYLLAFIIVAGFLTATAFKVEFEFLHVMLGLGILLLGLFNFELSLLLVPLSLTNPYPIIEDGFNLTFSEFALLIIFVVWFVRMTTGEVPTLFPRRFLIPAALMVGASMVSLVAARHIFPAALQVVRYIEILFFLFILVVNYFRTPESIRGVAMSLWAGGLIACVAGLVQFTLGLTEENEAGRIFLWHGGGYGALVAGTLWFSFSMLLYDKERLARLVALIGVPLASIVLILSQTRTWMGAVVVVLFLAPIMLRKKGSLKLVLIVGCVILLVVSMVQTNVFGMVSEETVETVVSKAFRFGVRGGEYSIIDLSLLIRFNIWFHGIRIFGENPVTGIGVGNLRFDDYFTGRLAAPSEEVGYVDNQYIQAFAEMGVIGGIAWILLIFRAVGVGRNAASTTEDPRLHAITVGLFGWVLIFAIGGAFWVITPHHELFGILVLAVGLLINSKRIQP